MALSIKNEEADRLARQLSEITGESMTEVIVVALRERLERHRRAPGVEDRLLRLAAEVASYPSIDDRGPNEILDYNEIGVPR